MRKLDRSRPFGRVTPPYDGEGAFDRNAFFTQDGVFFDQHDREIVPGLPMAQIVPYAPGPVTRDNTPPPATVPAEGAGPGDAGGSGGGGRHPLDHDGDGRPGGSLPAGPLDAAMSPADLLRQADTLSWPQFRKQAKAIFGPDCPAHKDAIKAALIEKVNAEASAAPAPKPAAPTPPAPAPAPQGKATGVDLAAWGRGRQEYLFGDIRKAIRAQYGKVVTERHDAVDFLIEQGVITAESARKDV